MVMIHPKVSSILFVPFFFILSVDMMNEGDDTMRMCDYKKCAYDVHKIRTHDVHKMYVYYANIYTQKSTHINIYKRYTTHLERPSVVELTVWLPM